MRDSWVRGEVEYIGMCRECWYAVYLLLVVRFCGGGGLFGGCGIKREKWGEEGVLVSYACGRMYGDGPLALVWRHEGRAC